MCYQKCVSHVQVDSRELDRRKTLQMTNTVKPAADNDEFEKQRTAAIAEVAKSKEVRMHMLQHFTSCNWSFLVSWTLLTDKHFLMFAFLKFCLCIFLKIWIKNSVLLDYWIYFYLNKDNKCILMFYCSYNFDLIGLLK